MRHFRNTCQACHNCTQKGRYPNLIYVNLNVKPKVNLWSTLNPTRATNYARSMPWKMWGGGEWMQVQACNIATTSSDMLQVWSDNLIKKDLIKHIKARHRVEISPKFLEKMWFWKLHVQLCQTCGENLRTGNSYAISTVMIMNIWIFECLNKMARKYYSYLYLCHFPSTNIFEYSFMYFLTTKYRYEYLFANTWKSKYIWIFPQNLILIFANLILMKNYIKI